MGKHGRSGRLPSACVTCRNSGLLRPPEGYPTLGDAPRYCDCYWGNRLRQRDAQDRAEMRAAVEDNRRRALARKLILPARHAAYTLDDHPLRTSPDAHGCAAYQKVMRWLATWDGHRGLILRGGYGVGKTSMLVGVLKRLVDRAITEGWEMRFTTSLDLFDELKRGFNTDADRDDRYGAVLDDYKTVRLLALDDLCAEEHQTTWQQDQYLAILNARYNANLPLLATTNLLTDGELVERLTQRVYDRLAQTCDVIDVQGPNLRDR